MAGKDYYKILGVARNASDKEIKQAYRRLARKHHPDINPGDRTAESKFKEINEAHEILSSPDKRKKYDQYGDQWQYADQFAQAGWQPSAGQQPFSAGPDVRHEYANFAPNQEGLGGIFDELFQRFGSKTGARGTHTPHRGEDIEHQIEVSLEESYKGSTRILQMQVQEPCSVCKGSGRIQRALCSHCNGQGTTSRIKRLEVKIPPGVKTGSKIRIAGEGSADRYGGENGDLYLKVTVMSHNLFRRKDNDLEVDVQLPLTVAVLGGEVSVPTMKGRVMLKIPPETQNEKVFKLTGQGMPHLGNGNYGDLLVRAKIIIPTRLSPQEKQLFEQLRAMHPGA